MQINEIKAKLNSDEYNFLKTDKHLGSNVILLTTGGSRNEKAAAHKKIAKHSMHLLRLYMMCIDILEKQKIVTYREKEHDLLMDIRNGKYLGADDKPLPEFFEIVSEYEKKLEYAKKNTTLPDEPDYERIMEFTAEVNEKVIKGEI